VITDIDMPGSMNGLKLAHVIRDRYPPTCLIVTTGKGRPTNFPKGRVSSASLTRVPTLPAQSVMASNQAQAE
jgi:hypothetical protein